MRFSYLINPSFRSAFPKAIAHTGGPPLCEYRQANGYSSGGKTARINSLYSILGFHAAKIRSHNGTRSSFISIRQNNLSALAPDPQFREERLAI